MDREGDNSISRGISANCSNPDPETLAPDVNSLAGIFLNGSHYYPVFEKKKSRKMLLLGYLYQSQLIFHI